MRTVAVGLLRIACTVFCVRSLEASCGERIDPTVRVPGAGVSDLSVKNRARLSCPLTSEDFAIWDGLSESGTLAFFPDGVPLWGYQESDRCDADILLSQESHKANGAPAFLIRCGQLYGWGGPFRAFVNLPQTDANGNIVNYA